MLPETELLVMALFGRGHWLPDGQRNSSRYIEWAASTSWAKWNRMVMPMTCSKMSKYTILDFLIRSLVLELCVVLLSLYIVRRIVYYTGSP